MKNKTKVTAVFALTIIAAFVWYVNAAEAEKFVTKGLVSFWTFDKSDIVGNTLKDVWGKNAGIIEGDPKAVKGNIEEALEFDGKDDCVKVPHDSSIDFGDKGFSVELWFKGNANTITGYYCILCKGFSQPPGKRYEFEIDSGEVLFVVDDDVTKTILSYPAGKEKISDLS